MIILLLLLSYSKYTAKYYCVHKLIILLKLIGGATYVYNIEKKCQSINQSSGRNMQHELVRMNEEQTRKKEKGSIMNT